MPRHIARAVLRGHGTIRASTFGPLRSTGLATLRIRTGPLPLVSQQRQRRLSTQSGPLAKDAIRETRSDEKATAEAATPEPAKQPAADMASDEDYMAFLNKANNDADEAHAAARAQSGGKAQLKTLDAGEQAPQAIVDVCKTAVYTSDADEPFVQVSLKWAGEGGLPDEDDFAKLVNLDKGAKTEISILDPLDWDVNGSYTDVLEAVRKASRGNDVRVYRVALDSTRVEYWLITRDGDRIVGAKALAIES